MSLSRKVLYLLVGAAVVWAALLLFVPSAHQERLFFCSAQDRYFFDYFIHRSVLTMAHPYAEAGMSPAIGMVPRYDQCYSAAAVLLTGLFPESNQGAIVNLILGAFCYLLGATLLFRKYSIRQPVLALSLLVSAQVLFAMQVSNQILYAAGAVFMFWAWYDSPRRSCRVIAAIALAVAAVMKIAPAVLGLLYLCSADRRNWRGAFFAGAVFVLLLFVPFAFLGGIDGFLAWVENAQVNSQTYAMRNAFGLYGLIAELISMVGYNGEVLPIIHAPLRLVSSAFAVCLLARVFVKGTDEFSRVCLIALGMLFLPPTMLCYTVLYLVPLFIIGTARCQGRLAQTFAICWVTSCIPLQVPLMLGLANALFSAAAMLDLCWLLMKTKVRQ